MEYTQNLMKKFYSHYVNSNEELEYYSNNAVAFLVEEYLSREDYKIHSSFKGALAGKIRQARLRKDELLISDHLYKRKYDSLSLNWVYEDGNNADYIYEDVNSSYIDYIENQENKLILFNHIEQLIFNIENYCSPEEDFKRILAVRTYIVTGEKQADRLFQEEILDKNNNIEQFKTYGRLAKYIYLQTLNILKKELLKFNKYDK